MKTRSGARLHDPVDSPTRPTCSPGRAAPTQRHAARFDESTRQAQDKILDAAWTAPVQLARDSHTGLEDAEIQAAAAHGVADGGGALPYLDAIQRSFGSHDVTSISAHVGGAAKDASHAMGAHAYATGNHVAFAQTPDLFLAAHEAAHVVQQRSGVQLSSSVGQAGDTYEQHADAVAARVVAGESAADLLDALAGGGSSSGVQRKLAVQRDGRRGGGAKRSQPQLAEIPASAAKKFIEPGVLAVSEFASAKELAQDLYEIILKQANAKAVHEQSVQAYKDAKEHRKKALEKSELMKAIAAIEQIAKFATGVYSLVTAGLAVYESAVKLKRAYDVYKEYKGEAGYEGTVESATDQMRKHAKEGAKPAWKGGKAAYDAHSTEKGLLGGAAPDLETLLSDTNAAAIAAGNTALDALTDSQIKFDMTLVQQADKRGAILYEQMVEGKQLLLDEGKVFPESSLAVFRHVLQEAQRAQGEYVQVIAKVQSVWEAYRAGGAEALADSRERNVFETIQGWIAAGDPKASSLHVAMDQDVKALEFWGTEVIHEGGPPGSGYTFSYFGHGFTEAQIQPSAGTLYISDQAAVDALRPLAGLAPDVREAYQGSGDAHRRENDRHSGDQKFVISVSLCKALASLGIRGTYTNAKVLLNQRHRLVSTIESPHMGDWYQQWWRTPEFLEFWRTRLRSVSALGPQWFAYVINGTRREVIPGADLQTKLRSFSSPEPGHRLPPELQGNS